MDTLFKSSSTFASLSLKDLIEARDLFHYHLINKRNVVATAVGLYRIRKGDPWPTKDDPNATAGNQHRGERRTLGNSQVRPYSWPCVYVFVSSWQDEAKLSETDPSDVVPKTLYLPDGRAVPVCVIEAPPQPLASDLKIDPDKMAGRAKFRPGSAIVNEHGQGMPRLATAGCIVRDGDAYYVLTNRHAVGPVGTPITALQHHRAPVIGTSAAKGLTREDFKEVYPAFASRNQRLLMDIGLIELDDVLQWQTAIPGISPIRPVLDLYDNSFTLKLITMKVVGQSAVTGRIRGEIHALFYRYKALGGSEYLSDFLIGPETCEPGNPPVSAEAERAEEDKALVVHHGDSGTLLFIEHCAQDPDGKLGAPGYHPFAVLWGKEEFVADGGTATRPYAMATALSTALDRLDLELVTNLNADQTYVWGWVGHYTIGRALSLPADIITQNGLRDFITKNIDLLAVAPNDALSNNPHAIVRGQADPNFVALADVPDNVWKSNVNFIVVDGPDGKKKHQVGPGSRGQNDNPNHFADLDQAYQGVETFLKLNRDDPDTYLNPQAWIAYFAAMRPQYDEWARLLDPDKPRYSNHWGALPFRVHQLFDTMVAAAKAGDQALFLTAGGVLIHYVGDACQPLHASYLSQGDPARVVKRPRAASLKLEADGVHSGYEDDMIACGYQSHGLVAALATRIQSLPQETGEAIAKIDNGHDAAKAIIALIDKTQSELSPREIVEKWVELAGQRDKDELMWDAFGTRTVTCMARGTRYLAALWSAAWELGGGEQKIGSGAEISTGAITALYNDPAIVPSIPLNRYPDNQASDWSTL